MNAYLVIENVTPDDGRTRPGKVYTDRALADADAASQYYGGRVVPVELVTS